MWTLEYSAQSVDSECGPLVGDNINVLERRGFVRAEVARLGTMRVEEVII